MMVFLSGPSQEIKYKDICLINAIHTLKSIFFNFLR